MSVFTAWKRGVRWATISVACMSLIACASPKPADYADEKPVLDLREYFNGDIDAYGIFTDRGGHVVRRFVVTIKARWEGEKGVLEEDFVYSDGEKQRRVWTLIHQGDGKYIGTADDVVGEASGQVAGNAFQWSYVLRLPVGDRTYDVSFNDWMYLMSDKVMLNKATMSKFGIRLGEVTLSFHKR
ncbi:MAG: DUF3833 domain-containing protein [Alcaligenaceae bacterium]|nr:DUF3833 domain-containing protein [Alcaligenaceae bacterium]